MYVRNSLPAGNYQKLDTIVPDSVTTSFTISIGGVAKSVGNANQLLISLNNVILNPGTAFSVSGSTITFAVAPTTGHAFFGILLGEKLTVLAPGANTVTTAALQDGSVTAAKIASGAVNTTAAKVFSTFMA